MLDKFKKMLEESLAQSRNPTKPLARSKNQTIKPQSRAELTSVLHYHQAHGIALMPMGAGTCKASSNAPSPDATFLDLSCLNEWKWYPEHQELHCGPGVTHSCLVQICNQLDLNLNLQPPSDSRATLGGLVATGGIKTDGIPSSAIHPVIAGLEVLTPGLGLLSMGSFSPNSPNKSLMDIFLGSEGHFGIIVNLALKMSPLPETRIVRWFSLPSFQEGTWALRELSLREPPPAFACVLDCNSASWNERHQSPEASKLGSLRAFLSCSILSGSNATLILGEEGTNDSCTQLMERSSTLLERFGAKLLLTNLPAKNLSWPWPSFFPKIRGPMVHGRGSILSSWDRLANIWTSLKKHRFPGEICLVTLKNPGRLGCCVSFDLIGIGSNSNERIQARVENLLQNLVKGPGLARGIEGAAALTVKDRLERRLDSTYLLFDGLKEIFDPDSILNPGASSSKIRGNS